MLSAASGQLMQVGSNIHTDDEYARHEGLPGVTADGMIMANWCLEMMVHHFGLDYIERGELRTKFIRPVLLDVMLHVKGRITSAEAGPNGETRYSLAIWCEDEHGMKLTYGDAKVEARP